MLGVDTLVALDARIYGKPADEHEARGTLAALCAETHTVLSGIALLAEIVSRWGSHGRRSSSAELDEELIDWYVASGEWRGRAGGYAIQGIGAVLVREIRGDYENVVGLPLAKLWTWPRAFPGTQPTTDPEALCRCKYAVKVAGRTMWSARLPAGYAPERRDASRPARRSRIRACSLL